MEAHQETSPTLREGQECSTKEQTEGTKEQTGDMEAHQRTPQEQTEVLHTEETKDEPIEKLQKQLDKARIEVDKLTKQNESLKVRKLRLENDNKKLEAEMAEKNKKAEELKATIKELEQQLEKKTNQLTEEKRKLTERSVKKIQMLKTKLAEVSKVSHKDFRDSLQQAGEICKMNCVMSCLVSVCQLKMQDVHLCYDHLARIIMHGEEDKQYLKCGAYLSLLVEKEMAKREEQIDYNSDAEARDKQIDEIWEILKTTTGARIMILGRKMVAKDKARGEARHTILCDVEDREEEDKLAFYDLQRREWGRGTKENLKDYLKEDTGINLYTLNLDSLKKLIEEKRDLDDETCCKSGISKEWINTAENIFRHNRIRPTIL